MTRDLFGLSKAMQAIAVHETGAEITGLTKAKDRLVKFADSRFGIKNLADDFKRLRSCEGTWSREVIHCSQQNILKVRSHPTAWAVNSELSGEADNDIRDMFLLDGIELVMNAIIRICKFILEHFPAPPNSPIS